MEFIKKFDEINEDTVGGENNYNLIKKIFLELKEEQIVLINTFETYYICIIKKTDMMYYLYHTYIKDDIIKKDKDPIFTIARSNKYIDDDIILINDKEKKYYEFILIKNNINKIRKFHQPNIEITTLSSEKDYNKYNKKKIIENNKREIHQYKKDEVKTEKVITNPKDLIYDKYRR